MITCAQCGGTNEDHYKFCLKCGASLAQQAAPEPEPVAATDCPQCGAAVQAGQKFCGSCGFRLEATASQPAAPAPAPQEAAPAPAEPAPAPQEPAPQAEPAPAPQEAALAPQQPAAAAEPAATGPGKLTMINPDGSPGDVFQLRGTDTVIGRSTDAAVFQRDEYLSPEHARFVVEGDEVEIHDLDSLNGVYYRIAPNTPTRLQHGDVIRVGQEVLRFEVAGQFTQAKNPPQIGGEPVNVWARLARISAPENAASSAYLLFHDEHTLGRERGDYTFPDDGFVSGQHARVMRADDGFYVEDLRSSNGTFLRVRGSQRIPNGTLLLLGRQPFRIQLA